MIPSRQLKVEKMNWPLTLLLANAVSTLCLVGLIWLVQVVHYPLFNDVGEQNYASYQQRHQNSITYVVGPLMLIELITAIMMLVNPVEGIGKPFIYLGIVLVLLIWLSTAFIQVPCHGKLATGFNVSAYKLLVNSNWIRTIAWTGRGVLVTWMLAHVLSR